MQNGTKYKQIFKITLRTSQTHKNVDGRDMTFIFFLDHELSVCGRILHYLQSIFR